MRSACVAMGVVGLASSPWSVRVHGCVRLCVVVHGCARLCTVVRGCARLCTPMIDSSEQPWPIPTRLQSVRVAVTTQSIPIDDVDAIQLVLQLAFNPEWSKHHAARQVYDALVPLGFRLPCRAVTTVDFRESALEMLAGVPTVYLLRANVAMRLASLTHDPKINKDIVGRAFMRLANNPFCGAACAPVSAAFTNLGRRGPHDSETAVAPCGTPPARVFPAFRSPEANDVALRNYQQQRQDRRDNRGCGRHLPPKGSTVFAIPFQYQPEEPPAPPMGYTYRSPPTTEPSPGVCPPATEPCPPATEPASDVCPPVDAPSASHTQPRLACKCVFPAETRPPRTLNPPEGEECTYRYCRRKVVGSCGAACVFYREQWTYQKGEWWRDADGVHWIPRNSWNRFHALPGSVRDKRNGKDANEERRKYAKKSGGSSVPPSLTEVEPSRSLCKRLSPLPPYAPIPNDLKSVFTQLLRFAHARACGPLPLNEFAARVGGVSQAARLHRANVIGGLQAIIKHAAVMIADIEFGQAGSSRPKDVHGLLVRLKDAQVASWESAEGSHRNADGAAHTKAELRAWYTGLHGLFKKLNGEVPWGSWGSVDQQHLEAAGVNRLDWLAGFKGLLPEFSPSADNKGSDMPPFSWAMDHLVRICFPGREAAHRALEDCYATAAIVAGLASALIDWYGEDEVLAL